MIFQEGGLSIVKNDLLPKRKVILSVPPAMSGKPKDPENEGIEEKP